MTKKWSSRLTFFAFVVLMVGLGSNDSLRGIFSTIFQEHFSLTTTQLGLIVTASYIGNLVFLLVGGNLSTRFSKKRVLQVLILIWMAALALFAFTSNYTVLLIGMALALGSSTLLNTRTRKSRTIKTLSTRAKRIAKKNCVATLRSVMRTGKCTKRIGK